MGRASRRKQLRREITGMTLEEFAATSNQQLTESNRDKLQEDLDMFKSEARTALGGDKHLYFGDTSTGMTICRKKLRRHRESDLAAFVGIGEDGEPVVYRLCKHCRETTTSIS